MGPPILGGGYTPDFGHAFSNPTHFRACDRFWLNFVQRAWRVADERKNRRRIAVKPRELPTTTSGGLR